MVLLGAKGRIFSLLSKKKQVVVVPLLLFLTFGFTVKHKAGGEWKIRVYGTPQKRKISRVSIVLKGGRHFSCNLMKVRSFRI